MVRSRQAPLRGGGEVKRLVLLLSLAAVTLVVAAPATANNKQTTGTKVSLFAPPSTLPADTPFFIEGGFTAPVGDGDGLGLEISAQSGFTLYLDGVLQPSTVDVDLVGGWLEKRYLTNYPDGLPAGAHTFVGQAYLGGTLVDTRTVTITFS